jgi:N-acetylglutamate synthase-like GNAT family acetyltransferase
MIKIRKATMKDATKIANLIKMNLLKAKINKYTLEQKKGIIKKNAEKAIKERIKKFDVFCAVEDEKIIGTIYLGRIYMREYNIGGLYITPSVLNKGLGKKLLNYAENYAKGQRIKKIKLYSLRNAKEFYLKNGYKITKKYFWKVGDTKTKTYGMEKKLK